MFPKAIWTSLYEKLKLNNPHEMISNNVSVIYYKRVQHAKRFYGEDADWTGWGRPSDYFGKKYDNLEKYADAIVYVPAGGKKACIKAGMLSSLVKREIKRRELKLSGKIYEEIRFDAHIEPRVLFNECFYVRVNIKTLERLPIANELDPTATPSFKIISCGSPLLSNSWLVDSDNRLCKIHSNNQTVYANEPVNQVYWQPVELPSIPTTIEEKKEDDNDGIISEKQNATSQVTTPFSTKGMYNPLHRVPVFDIKHPVRRFSEQSCMLRKSSPSVFNELPKPLPIPSPLQQTNPIPINKYHEDLAVDSKSLPKLNVSQADIYLPPLETDCTVQENYHKSLSSSLPNDLTLPHPLTDAFLVRSPEFQLPEKVSSTEDDTDHEFHSLRHESQPPSEFVPSDIEIKKTQSMECDSDSETEVEVISIRNEEEKTVTVVAPGDEGSCWIVYAGLLFYKKKENQANWIFVKNPSEWKISQIALRTISDGVWVVDECGSLFCYLKNELRPQEKETFENALADIQENGKNVVTDVEGYWLHDPEAPRFSNISLGKDQELWGVTAESLVYRRLKIKSGNKQRFQWIQIHGAFLKSVSVFSSEEVWGLDADGHAYIWASKLDSQNLSEDIELNQPVNNKTKLSWQRLGNILPLSKISIDAQHIPWALSIYDHNCFYKLSTHRLLIFSTLTSRKIWDDRKTGCHPYNIGYFSLVLSFPPLPTSFSFPLEHFN